MKKEVRRGRCLGDNEDIKLELRLGPPGEDWSEMVEPKEEEDFFDSDLSLKSFKASNDIAAHLSVGTKRGFFENIELKTEGFRHSQSKTGMEKEMLQKTNGRTEQQLSVESDTASGSMATAHNRSLIRSASSPVVGWPPIRSSRKNLAGTSKLAVVSQSGSSETARKHEFKRTFFVKINMEGIPIGRKIDLLAYDCYEKLSLAVDELFRDLLAAQNDPLVAINKITEKHVITGGEYTLIYEDDEGDRMLVGDVPWDMFVSTAKRLRVLKSSELSSSSSSMETISRKKKPA